MGRATACPRGQCGMRRSGRMTGWAGKHLFRLPRHEPSRLELFRFTLKIVLPRSQRAWILETHYPRDLGKSLYSKPLSGSDIARKSGIIPSTASQTMLGVVGQIKILSTPIFIRVLCLLFSSVTFAMNKNELIEAVAGSAELPKEKAAKAVDAVIENIKAGLAKGDTVTLVGFGTFTVKERAARAGRNPRTGETIDIKAAKVPSFKPGKALKDALN